MAVVVINDVQVSRTSAEGTFVLCLHTHSEVAPTICGLFYLLIIASLGSIRRAGLESNRSHFQRSVPV